VFRRLPRLAIAAALAWVGMVVSYSRDALLKEALAKVFDGKHPCRLCREIAKGKQSEKKSASAPAGKKFEFLYEEFVGVCFGRRVCAAGGGV
jgi:hypothetical protein